MDIELRNQLGALSAQVQELTKQAKVLDGALAGAMDHGTKSAAGMASGASRIRHEMGLAEEVSNKIGAKFTKQMVEMAVGSLSVMTIWQTVSAAMDKAQQQVAASGKATADYAAGSRLPGDNPTMRRALRESAPFLTSDEQSASLKAYRRAGGSGKEADVRRLGKLLDQGVVSGIDPAEASATYARLSTAGVKNPEDAIARASSEIDKRTGKPVDLSSMNPGALRAFARSEKTTGALDRLRSETKLEEIDQLELTLRAVTAKKKNEEARSPSALRRSIYREVSESEYAGTEGAAAPLYAGDIAAARESADDPAALRAEARAYLEKTALFKVLVTDAAVERLAKERQAVRKNLPAQVGELPNVQRQTTRVVISGDDRPIPVNVGH